MANYNNLKATINANIKANGNEEITGPILNTVLNQAVTTLGDGWSYKGIATPSMSPGTPDSNVFYIATTAGTYTNFGSLAVAEGEVAILKYNGSWAKEVSGAATAAQVTQLGQEVDEIRSNVDGQNQEIADFEETITNQIDNFQPIVIEGNVTNAPDEEDITTDENDLLKFANRGTLHGMGYVILRRDKTFAEQVTLTNTIYEIRYDFDLNGASVTIPAGCVLKFVGGKLSNGTLVGDNTNIVCGKKIFDNVTFSGTWFVENISTDFFVGIPSIRNVFNLTNANIHNKVIIEKGNYPESFITLSDGDGYHCVKVKSNTDIILNGTITANATDKGSYSIFLVKNCSNVHISGSGEIIGDRDVHTGATGEWGMGINVLSAQNVTIEGVSVKKCWGDCIYVGDSSDNIFIRGCNLSLGRRQGVSVVSCGFIEIESCTIDGIEGTSPEAGIDIEPNGNDIVSCAIISNCGIFSCNGYGINIQGRRGSVEKVSITNCICEGKDYVDTQITQQGIRIANMRSLIISNVTISKVRFGITALDADNIVIDSADIYDVRLTLNLSTGIGRISCSNSILSGDVSCAAVNCESMAIYDSILENNNAENACIVMYDSCEEILVKHCQVENKATGGIILDCPQNIYLEDCIVIGSTLLESNIVGLLMKNCNVNVSFGNKTMTDSIIEESFFSNPVLIYGSNIQFNKNIVRNSSATPSLSFTGSKIFAEDNHIYYIGEEEVSDIVSTYTSNSRYKGNIIETGDLASYGIHIQNDSFDVFDSNVIIGTASSWAIGPGANSTTCGGFTTLFSRFGSTANRPSLNRRNIQDRGFNYYDETLAKPIWFIGSDGWVDATGTSV